MKAKKQVKPDVEKAFQITEMPKLHFVTDQIAIGKVFGDTIIAEEIVPYTKLDELETQGLICAPESVKKEVTPDSSNGLVVAVGPDVKNVKVGMLVAFGRHAGRTIQPGLADPKHTVLLRVLKEIEVAFEWVVAPGQEVIKRKKGGTRDLPANTPQQYNV